MTLFRRAAGTILAIGIAAAKASAGDVPEESAVANADASDFAGRVGGCVVMDRPVGGIVVLRMTTLQEFVVRESHVGQPAIQALAGPDEEGRIAFIEEIGSARTYSLKTIKLDGSDQSEVFKRSGSVLWDKAIDELSLAPRGGRIAFLTQPPASRRRFAPPIQSGPVEI